MSPPTPPWTQWQPGERVVVRYRAADGLHDALGDVVETGPDAVVIRTRRGDVRVPAATMLTGKRVPPPPPRRARADQPPPSPERSADY